MHTALQWWICDAINKNGDWELEKAFQGDFKCQMLQQVFDTEIVR